MTTVRSVSVDISTGRTYAGKAPGERRADRRARLLDAGLQVFGTVTWDEAGITLICATARVGTRAFYEEFDNREALLLEVATGIVERGSAILRLALDGAPATLEGVIGTGLTSFLGFVTNDPRRARVIYGAVPCAESLISDRHRAAHGLAVLLTGLQPSLGIADRARDNPTLALALVGAAGELLGAWVSTPTPTPIDDLINELTLLFVAALR